MKYFIECKKSSDSATLDFYVSQGSNSYYLFNQRYRHSVYEHFKTGVPITNALDHGKARHNTALINVINRLFPTIKYVEKYYSVSILEKSRSASRRPCRSGYELSA